MRLFIDTFVRWVIAAGLFAGAIAYFGAPQAIDFVSWLPNIGVTAIIVAAMAVMTAVALEGINRCLILLSCWCDPQLIQEWIKDLDSPSLWRKRRALRTLTDYLEGNAGVIGPFAWCGSAELEAQVAIVKNLWAARLAMVADCPSQGQLLQRLGRNMKESFWRLAQYRIDWMVTRIPEYFRPSADVPDADTQGQTAALFEESLSLPETLPPLEPSRLIEAMEARVRDTLQKAAQVLNDAPTGTLIVDSEEPVGELLAQLFLEAYQVALLLRMGSLQVDASEMFSTDRGGLSKGFRLFEEIVERAGNAVKDALLDLNLVAEEIQAKPTSEDLPFMSPDEFTAAMRPHVEHAFKQFVEITNQTPTGLILVAEEAGLCRIFAQLHAKALETGLELRLQRKETLWAAGQPKEKAVAAPHLRKAASPPLPAPYLGWAAKYRCMRIAGTRFPLIHEETRKTQSPHFPNDPPVTSVKPGSGEDI
jgi:hypothetical protein